LKELKGSSSLATLPSGLPEWVDDDEALARFLTSSSQFNSLMVKPTAFLPNPKNGETSVFRHAAEPRDALWEIGAAYVVGDRTLHGAAVFKARYVREAGLEVKAHEPPPRHANIVGWPAAGLDQQMIRAEQKERALVIAQFAELVCR
jgi:hypothetical protein